MWRWGQMEKLFGQIEKRMKMYTDASRRNKIHIECYKTKTIEHDWARFAPG